MLFRNTDIIKAVRMRRIEELQAGSVFHGSGDRTDARITLAELRQLSAENGREAFVD